ncbi:MAG TPA: PIG-L family deacetylase [Candidatus Binatia bacterium]|nr:PIG-L family deacetylase [Candidatus Binatia bacterium]
MRKGWTRRRFLRTAALAGAAPLIARRAWAGDAAPGAAKPGAGPAPGRPFAIGHGERLLVIAPHPDDETIGAAGLIQQVLGQGGTVRVLLLTAGDGYVEAVVRETGELQPRPAQFIAYGERRLREARAAMRQLDHDRIRLQIMGFPDGGLNDLLRAHWRRSNPERSRTTGASDPPYDAEVIDPDIPYDGADLRHELGNIIREARPTIVALPDPLDTHPDHHAAGVFTLLATADWLHASAAGKGVAPKLLAYLVHWPAWPPGWDAVDPALVADSALTLPAGLSARGLGRVSVALDERQVAAKRAALARYASQQEVMASFLAAFVRHDEPFTQLGASDMASAGSLVEGPEAPPLQSPAAAHGDVPAAGGSTPPAGATAPSPALAAGTVVAAH